jgi:hypothetical protein
VSGKNAYDECNPQIQQRKKRDDVSVHLVKEILSAFLIEGTWGRARRFVPIGDIHVDFFLLRHFGCFVEEKARRARVGWKNP